MNIENIICQYRDARNEQIRQLQNTIEMLTILSDQMDAKQQPKVGKVISHLNKASKTNSLPIDESPVTALFDENSRVKHEIEQATTRLSIIGNDFDEGNKLLGLTIYTIVERIKTLK